jgi:YHS domain-containing protein
MHMSIDPICGMEVDETKAAGKSTYRDQVFYFCSPQCKQKFDENPESIQETERNGPRATNDERDEGMYPELPGLLQHMH